MLLFFETEHLAQTSLKFPQYPKMILTFNPHACTMNAKTTDIHYYANQPLNGALCMLEKESEPTTEVELQPPLWVFNVYV